MGLHNIMRQVGGQLFTAMANFSLRSSQFRIESALKSDLRCLHFCTIVRPSGNSQVIHDPFDLPIFVAFAMIESNQHLVRKDRGQQLRLIVRQASVPHMLGQFE